MTTAAPSKSAPAVAPRGDRARRVGDLLLEKGLITRAQLDQAVAHPRERGHQKLLGEVLVELKFAAEEQVLEVLAGACGVPFARVSPRIADPKVVEILPRDFLEKNTVLPLFCVNGRLTVAVHEPSNVFLIEEIQRLSGCAVQIVAATARDIRATLQTHLPNANVFVIDEIVDDLQGDDLTLVERQVADLADPEAGPATPR